MSRLIRILVYEGSSIAINQALKMRGVKGCATWGSNLSGGPMLIREAILGDFLEEFSPDIPKLLEVLAEASPDSNPSKAQELIDQAIAMLQGKKNA